MSSDNAVTVQYSDGNASRGTWVGGEAPAPATPTPSVAHVEPVGNSRVEGADLAVSHGAGILATILDGHTADLVRGRAPTDNDLCTITTNTGREMRVRVRNAINEGFLFRDEHGRLHEADRSGQQAAFDELQRLEASRREAGQVKYGDATENAVAEISAAMTADGMDFTQTLAEFLGSDGDRINEATQKWAAANGLGDFRGQLQNYMSTMRAAVISQVLAPQGISPDFFLEYLKQNRTKANAAAIRAHVAKDLNYFRQLAFDYRNSGWMAKQRGAR